MHCFKPMELLKILIINFRFMCTIRVKLQVILTFLGKFFFNLLNKFDFFFVGQVTLGLGQVNLFLTCPKGQVDLKVNVKPCCVIACARCSAVATHLLFWLQHLSCCGVALPTLL